MAFAQRDAGAPSNDGGARNTLIGYEYREFKKGRAFETFRNGRGQPQTSSAVSAISRSLATSSS